jgi:hypothetical protein
MKAIKARAVKFSDEGVVYLACDTSWTYADAKRWKKQAVSKGLVKVSIVPCTIRELPKKARGKR